MGLVFDQWILFHPLPSGWMESCGISYRHCLCTTLVVAHCHGLARLPNTIVSSRLVCGDDGPPITKPQVIWYRFLIIEQNIYIYIGYHRREMVNFHSLLFTSNMTDRYEFYHERIGSRQPVLVFIFLAFCRVSENITLIAHNTW